MPDGRRTRTELLRMLEPTLGQEAAGALVDELGDVGQLATKADLADVRAEIAAVRHELREEITAVRHDLGLEIATFRERVEGRFERVEESITSAKNEVLAAYRGELVDAVAGQTRAIMFTMAGTVVSLGGLAIAVAQFA